MRWSERTNGFALTHAEHEHNFPDPRYSAAVA
jgi:hypothetical protein